MLCLYYKKNLNRRGKFWLDFGSALVGGRRRKSEINTPLNPLSRGAGGVSVFQSPRPLGEDLGEGGFRHRSTNAKYFPFPLV